MCDGNCKCKEEFQVGDIVEWCGVQGKVDSIIMEDDYSLCVLFGEDNDFAYFTLDGKYIHWHKTPSLKLISRPKKKVKKTYWISSAKSLQNNNMRTSSHLYLSKADAEIVNHAGTDKQIHSIEIEEE